MREVTFTDHLEFEFEGNVLKNAICLGDVNNDGFNELIIGNDKGDLAIFKGECSKPIRYAKALGMITAIAVGNVMNVDRNMLIVTTGCGHCYIFDFDKDSLGELSKKPMVPLHTQCIPANVKVVLIGDVNGDGLTEIIVGLTDRVVRTYHWVNACDSAGDKLIGKLVGLSKWEFAEQIGTITLHKFMDGKPCVLVAQPAGTFITLKVDPLDHNHSVLPSHEPPGEFLTKISLNLEPLTPSKLHNSEICGNIKSPQYKVLKNSRSIPFAVATLDGIIMLVQDGAIIWKQSVNQELFALNCVDLTGDGNEEVVACAWDGSTYIVLPNNECITFSFQESVNTFTAGMFGFKQKQVPALVYVTFNNKIFLYNDISVPCACTSTLMEILQDNDEYKMLVKSLGIDVLDGQSIKELNKFALYGFRES